MSDTYRWVNPLREKGWDNNLLARAGTNFFHSSAWAGVLSDAYGHRPDYLAGDDLATAPVVPLMEARSWATGRRGVGLPFSDCVPPLLAEGTDWQKDVVPHLLDRGREKRWRFVELRDALPPQPGAVASARFHGHTLDLTRGEAALLKGLSSSTRRNVRKAQRQDLRLETSTDEDGIREFCRLNVLTRRLHGLPPQPWRFFRHLVERVLAQNHGRVVLARHQGRAIAAAVYFEWGPRAYYKYGASDLQHQEMRANNLVMWHAILSFAERGFESLCFGRTGPWNEGLRRFKLGWGTQERTIDYYRYDLRRGSFVVRPPRVEGRHNALFRRMPIPLLRMTGTLLYRHVT